MQYDELSIMGLGPNQVILSNIANINNISNTYIYIYMYNNIINIAKVRRRFCEHLRQQGPADLGAGIVIHSYYYY